MLMVHTMLNIISIAMNTMLCSPVLGLVLVKEVVVFGQGFA